MGRPVLAPETLLEYGFDVILIASQYACEIRAQLLSLGIEKSRIETVGDAILRNLDSPLACFRKISWRWVGCLLAAPVLLLFTTPWRFIQVLLSLRVLAHAPLNSLSRMTVYRSLNSSFHRAYDLLMCRYGRNGYAYEIGLGRSLAEMFWLTPLSMRAYRSGEAVIPWSGLLLMIVSQAVWFGQSDYPLVVSSVMILGLASPLFFFCSFEGIKYDSLGWALVPIGYYTLVTGDLWSFGVVFLIITFLSFSVAVAQGAIWILWGMSLAGGWIVVASLLALVKLSTHFLFLLKSRDWAGIENTLSGIGFRRSGAKRRQLQLGFEGIWLSAVWTILLIAVAVMGEVAHSIPKSSQVLLVASTIGLLLCNRTYRRFADDQTIHLCGLCAFSVILFLQPGWHLLPFFWLALAVPVTLLPFTDSPRQSAVSGVPPRLFPWNQTKFGKIVELFLNRVPRRQRILFHFDFEESTYSSFDGLRALKEYLALEALRRECALLPDFYLIFDGYAGRFPLHDQLRDGSPEGRLQTLRAFGARYIIVPEKVGISIPNWESAGFRYLDRLDFEDLREAAGRATTALPGEFTSLLLFEAGCVDITIAEKGELIDREPNCIKLKLDDSGEAIIRYLYCFGWRGEAGFTIGPASPELPWLKVQGPPGAVTEISYRL